MARWNGVILLAVALIGEHASAQVDDKPAGDPAATGMIVGRVVDLQGRPIVGADVWASFRGAKLGATRTDADGRFRVGPLKEENAVTMWAGSPGLARQRREGVHVFAGRDHDIGQITLLRGTRVLGRVVDAGGRPIADAKIMLNVYRHVLGHTIDSSHAEWALASAGDGRFTTPPLPAGNATFHVAAPGKVRTFASRLVEPGITEADLGDVTLADHAPIRGVVVDQEGAPAPGVEVYADYDYANATKTDKAGRFIVNGSGPDAKQLTLESNDYFAPKPFDLGPDRNDVKLTVIKSFEIHGSAVDAETGKPVTIDTISLCRVERNPDGSYNLVG